MTDRGPCNREQAQELQRKLKETLASLRALLTVVDALREYCPWLEPHEEAAVEEAEALALSAPDPVGDSGSGEL